MQGESDPKKVVVTLTGSGGERLTQMARELGWQAAHWPGLRFEPAADVNELAAQLVDALAEADWLVVTSPQGVRSLREVATAVGYGSEFLSRVQVAAVGEGTAQPLAAWGRAADFVPSRAQAVALADELPAPEGHCVLHVTGEDSHEALGLGLKRRGINYRRCVLYRSVAVTYSPDACQDFLDADAVVVGSGVVVRGLAQQLGLELRLVAMGEQTAAAASATGFASVIQAARPSVEGVLETLENMASKRATL